MLTFKQASEQFGIPVNTLYSWLYRGQLEEKGFKHIVVGSVNLLKKTNGPKNKGRNSKSETGKKR
jgi:hypothetical protein